MTEYAPKNISSQAGAIMPPPIAYEKWRMCGKYFEWQNHHVYYQRGGTGEPLLMIHGFPTCSWDWAWVSRLLVDDFFMVLPDLLDYGQSLNARRAPCSIMEQADMIEALMRHRNMTATHIVAHDVGDTVTQELLARQEEGSLTFRIESVVFLNGGMIPSLHRPRKGQLLLAGPFGPVLARIMPKKKLLEGFAEVFGPKTRPTGETLAMFWDVIVGANGRGALARRIRYMAERRTHADRWVGALTKADIPLMLINGLDDPVSGAHAADGFEWQVPQARVVRLPGIGHFPLIEAPDTVAELIKGFHKQFERPATTL